MANTKNQEIETLLEIDGETGEAIERSLTDEEIAQRNIEAQEWADTLAQEKAALEARQASIRKMAEASGLTEAEIEALF